MKNIPIMTLGEATIPSPLRLNNLKSDTLPGFTSNETRVLNRAEINDESIEDESAFEKAGPRGRIFFHPAKTRAAIVTCGGLCPGLNNVIRSLVLELYHNYGVRDIYGICYGYLGMGEKALKPMMKLDPNVVAAIDRLGGSLLGCSRGSPEVNVRVDFLAKHKIDILFTVGGDGTQRGAMEISREAGRRSLKIAVIGVPKTIDNDILYVDRTFGVTTAIDRARDILDAAHAEAKSYPNGIALVKLMGRDSGFISAGSTLASQEVNFTLIPELPFQLHGPRGFLSALKERVLEKNHALIVVAEGAGQGLISGTRNKDASGNILHKDIGPFLKEQIVQYFEKENISINLKYIDPSYYIRSVAAGSDERILCDIYARQAVHAAMSGRTEMIIGMRREFIHVPMEIATSSRQRISLHGDLWRSVLSSTGQPAEFV
jgi:6-phosphofructokinase 1